MIDKFDASAFKMPEINVSEKVEDLNKAFESKFKAIDEVSVGIKDEITERLSEWLDTSDTAPDKILVDTKPVPTIIRDHGIIPNNNELLPIKDQNQNSDILRKLTKIIETNGSSLDYSDMLIGGGERIDLPITQFDLPNTSVRDILKNMYQGKELPNGEHTLSLLDIANRKVNPEFKIQNLRQQAGFTAEIIGTAKENILAKIRNTGIETFRADDLPDLFDRNDPLVDKVRLDADGNIIERIQTKFVGKDAEQCLKKLMSSKYEKYFTGEVDKIEIPKEFYDEIRKNNLIPKQLEKLEEQLERVTQDGKTEVAETIKLRIERLEKLDNMLERSTVSKKEAYLATKFTKSYVEKILNNEKLQNGLDEGMGAAAIAVTITAGISTIDNVGKLLDKSISPEEAIKDIMKDSGEAGALGLGTGFISGVIATGMEQSTNTMIKTLGHAGVPAAAVSLAIDSYDSVVDFAQGDIKIDEFAYDIGESAAGIAGSMAGSVAAGAALGSVVPGAGTVVGAGVGLVGGMVGYAVASGAYATAVEAGSEVADKFADKAHELGNSTLEKVAEVAPKGVEDIKGAMNNVAAKVGLPFNL